MKITKKMIKEAPSFILEVDPRGFLSEEDKGKFNARMKEQNFYKSYCYGSSCNEGLFYKHLEATTLIDAMKEAEKYFDNYIYLLTISQKTDKPDGGFIQYKETIRSRQKGEWHICDEDHGEATYLIGYDLEYKYFTLLGDARFEGINQ